MARSAKYAYCQYGHPRPTYLDKCPVCDLAGVKAAANEGGLVRLPRRNGVTESRDGVTAIHCPTCCCEKVKVHESNAERQAAHRERSQR